MNQFFLLTKYYIMYIEKYLKMPPKKFRYYNSLYLKHFCILEQRSKKKMQMHQNLSPIYCTDFDYKILSLFRLDYRFGQNRFNICIDFYGLHVFGVYTWSIQIIRVTVNTFVQYISNIADWRAKKMVQICQQVVMLFFIILSKMVKLVITN